MAEQSTAERVGWAFISVLAFGVGALVGGRGCPQDASRADAPTTSQADASGQGAPAAAIQCTPTVVERLVEAPPKIIYECPPEPPPAPKKPGKATVDKKPNAKTPTPKPPELDARERQKLLAWVRDQSDDLQVCRDDRKDIYRVAVWLYLKEGTDQIARVDINASQGEVPQGVIACLRKRMLGWRPPGDLVRTHDTLVFGLTI